LEASGTQRRKAEQRNENDSSGYGNSFIDMPELNVHTLYPLQMSAQQGSVMPTSATHSKNGLRDKFLFPSGSVCCLLLLLS
jgi:hypothetical protein